ncbi:MAG: exodeoxyribonuclease VII small subunit [Treponema sp.]|nr:exodeoxyribonuclease VII small subunit [Treponema sp.]
MKNFEENLQKLEHLTEDIKKTDITLEEALKDFEEGIKLAKVMEKELDSIEGKVQILMNSPADLLTEQSQKNSAKSKGSKTESGPVLDLFNGDAELNGTRNA